jgi:carbonic anhydrase
MSCKDSTAPINIDMNNINGKCDLKCKYSFNYQENNSVNITNRNDYLLLSYNNGSSPAVKFNTYDYNVKEIRLFSPSLHSYNGFKVEAELIIIHDPITGSKPLLVCIPIKEGSSGSIGTIQLKTIINNAPVTIGQSASVNIPKYNLNSYVPKKPFFSYSGTNPYLPCGGNNDFIVYEPLNSDIFISSASLQNLKGIIKENAFIVSKNNLLYYNELGPEIGDGTDNIYIDCLPVGKSDEEVLVVDTPDSDTNYIPPTLNQILNNPYVQIILGSLLFVVLILFANIIFGFVGKTKIPKNIMSGGRKLTKNI